MHGSCTLKMYYVCCTRPKAKISVAEETKGVWATNSFEFECLLGEIVNADMHSSDSLESVHCAT